MVNNTVKAICYGMTALLCILCCIYLSAEGFKLWWYSYFVPAPFFLNLAAFLYTAYMTFLCIKNNGESPILSENLINDRNTNFMKDVYFKYLFSIAFAFGLSYFIGLVSKKFDIWDFNLYDWVMFYIQMVLPLIIFVDGQKFEHSRNPQVPKDFIVIAIILLIYAVFFTICSMIELYHGYNVWAGALANSMATFVYSFLGYLTYDLMLFRKTSNGDYVLFK